MEVNLSGLENELIHGGFEEDKRFFYSEFVSVSKELVERLKSGSIEDFAIIPSEDSSLEYFVYVKK